MRTSERVKRLERAVLDTTTRADVSELTDEALLDICFDGPRWRSMTDSEIDAELRRIAGRDRK